MTEEQRILARLRGHPIVREANWNGRVVGFVAGIVLGVWIGIFMAAAG